MVQAIDKYGTFTFVSHDYLFRKYHFVPFIPYCPDKSEYQEIAVFKILLRFKKAFYESNNTFVERVENTIYKNLEIYNRNHEITR
jgi:hypothetical protein